MVTHRILRIAATTLVCMLAAQAASAGKIRDRIMERRASQHQSEDGDHESATISLPPDTRVVRDVSYGSSMAQRFDVYSGKTPRDAPVIFMVHGGGWARGDKAMRNVVENKLAHWLPRGFVVISANYRMIPDAAPLEQAKDIARALSAAQDKAASWGADRSKFILMGHSAGAHLIALLDASPAISKEFDVTPWLGSVLLDSAAYDVTKLMQARHMPLFDKAFGNDRAYWRSASPFDMLSAEGPAILAVCSSRRDTSCPQAHQFTDKASTMHIKASVLEKNLSHMEINQELGKDEAYTAEVDAFLRSLGPSMEKIFSGASSHH